MRASVIVRSKDEADRLRLTLKSLALQSESAEIVVVNDGSTDRTEEVIDEIAEDIPICRIRNTIANGRSAAANMGAAQASGDILIFLDGDTLAGRDFVSKHMSMHRETADIIARGETHHLRCTRFFADPETGSPRSGEEVRVAAMSAAELARARITMRDVETDFPSIHRKSQPGIYPGAGPRRLFDAEMEALRNNPECGVLWAAASGSNQSMSRRAFTESGGFHEAITINEHRELALRLVQAGQRMVPANGAFSYHLTHRTGWRDPGTDPTWEEIFYRVHPLAAVPLLSVFWSSFSESTSFPTEARIRSLAELELAAARYDGIKGAEAVRKAHFDSIGIA
jgi:GT2 family glycosyltransferase